MKLKESIFYLLLVSATFCGFISATYQPDTSKDAEYARRLQQKEEDAALAQGIYNSEHDTGVTQKPRGSYLYKTKKDNWFASLIKAVLSFLGSSEPESEEIQMQRAAYNSIQDENQRKKNQQMRDDQAYARKVARGEC